MKRLPGIGRLRRFASKLLFSILISRKNNLKRFNEVYKDYRNKYLTRMPKKGDSVFAIPLWEGLSKEMEQYFLNKFSVNFLNNLIIRKTMFLDAGGFVQKKELAYLERNYPKPRLKELLKETPFGMPTITSFKYFTSHNTIHHLYHLSLFSELSRINLFKTNCVIEWGGGYGNMARLFYKFNPFLTYAIIDLPVFTAIQATYLTAVFGKDRVNLIVAPGDCIEAGKINIIPLDESLISQIDFHKPDIFVSTWALSESTEYTQKFIESKNYFGAESLLIAYQKKSDEIPDSEKITNHLGRHKPFYHAEIPHLENNFYLFC